MSPLSLSTYDLPQITITLEADAQKAEALALATVVTEVTDSMSQASAVEAMQALKRLMGGIEKARVEVKKPSLEFGKAIDQTARQFSASMDAEYQRLQGLVGAFQEFERKKALAAQEAQRKELERQNREEADRRANEERARAAGAPIPISVPKPPPPAPVAVVEPPKVKGLVVGEDWALEELNLAAVYAHHPKFIELKLKVSVVKDALRSGLLNDCPGLKITKITKARV